MSSIPSSAMPRARASEDQPPAQPKKEADRRTTADKVVAAVKDNPGTAAAIGAAVLGAAAAAIALPRKGGAKGKGGKKGKT